ncbi:MAG: hypothetical protein H5T39_00645 [Methanobacteriales archaeon]|nr:hypothetical protein [Methanobacteriales archaeon]
MWGFLTASLASWFVKSPESEKEFHDKIKIIEKRLDELRRVRELKESIEKKK